MAAEPRAHRIDRPWRLAVAAAIWIAWVAFVRPGAFDPAWPHALLLLAALVLVPLGLGLLPPGGERGQRSERLLALAALSHLPGALLLASACGRSQGPWAAVATLPWTLFTGVVALAGLERLRSRGLRRWRDEIGPITTDAGLVFLAVGGAWTLADRLGFRPLDVSPVIVLLTAVHFHYAGFVLPLVTGLAIDRVSRGRARPGSWATLAGLGAISGVPAVAVGITASQLGHGAGIGPGIEAVAAWTMASAGLLVASLHLRLAADRTAPPPARALWTLAALALATGMLLAALYGSRFLLPGVRWLDIGWMQALHGAANSLGFALPAVLGWRLAFATLTR